MIPRGRKAVDAVGAAEVLGMNVKTFRNQLPGDPAFPRPVNPGRRKPLWDLEQVQAYRDGTPIPALPEGQAADDLLDDQDIAAVRGVAYTTVRGERHAGRLVGWVDVCGVAHLPRGVLADQLGERLGRGVGGGRPPKRTEVRVMLTRETADHVIEAHLVTPWHPPADPLRMPADVIARDAEIPVNELPGRRFTAVGDRDGLADFQLVDDPRR